MKTRFIRNNLRPGLWLHRRSYGFAGRGIRNCLDVLANRISRLYGDGGPVEVFGNHDALVVPVEQCDLGDWDQLAIGEQKTLGAGLSTLDSWEKDMTAGTCEVRVYEVIGATARQEQKAANWWHEAIRGRPYDYMAYPRLIIKTRIGNLENIKATDCLTRKLKNLGRKAAGWEWAGWCTEDCQDCYKNGAGIDVLQTNNPTPLTVEQVADQLPRKPGKETTLLDVTKDCIYSLG